MNTPAFSFADLEKFQDENGHCTAASQNFNHDEIERLRVVYAHLVQTYHDVQMVDTEGCLRVTLESLNHRVVLAGSFLDVFAAVVEPLLARLRGLERQIIAMRADLERINTETGSGPLPETDAILAGCFPTQPSLTLSLPTQASPQAA